MSGEIDRTAIPSAVADAERWRDGWLHRFVTPDVRRWFVETYGGAAMSGGSEEVAGKSPDAPVRDTTPDAVQQRIDEVTKDLWGRHTTPQQRDALRKGIEHVERVPAGSDQAFGNIVGRRAG